MKKLWIIFLLFSLISYVSALEVNIPVPINYSLIPTTNSSDYWDSLDTPADISYDDLSGGDVNALGYYGYFNGILGVIGSLIMDGDPWYLSGTDLELAEGLLVHGISYLNTTLPYDTLLYDLGSGANRWRWLYVQNISSENIDTYNIHASENITVDGFINGVNITNVSYTYVPYSGATNNVDLGDKNLTTSGVIRNVTIWGDCLTAAATAAKTVTIPNYNLIRGDLLAIKFNLGNSVANPSLNINSIGGKPIRVSTTNASTTTMSLGVNSTILLFYDGTYFQMMGSQRTTDTDTYTSMYWGNTITAGAAIYDYKILMQNGNGKFYPLTLEEGVGLTKNVSQQGFIINSPILWYATTTNIAENGTLTNVYSGIATSTLNYTSNNGSWITQRPIYLKGYINGNGLLRLDNTTFTSFMTQDLPTTEDNYLYIYLGYMYGNTSFRLIQSHPIYEYKNGIVQQYVPMNITASNYILENGGRIWDNETCTFISSPDGSTIQEICNA